LFAPRLFAFYAVKKAGLHLPPYLIDGVIHEVDARKNTVVRKLSVIGVWGNNHLVCAPLLSKHVAQLLLISCHHLSLLKLWNSPSQPRMNAGPLWGT
jgi:hypothetical protein